jgi:hypothetical protein
MAVLVGISPEFEGRTFTIERDEVSVGRNDDNDVTIANHTVSGSHGTFVREGDTYRFRDLGSTNGTRLNGQPIQESVLKDRDIIHFGAMEFMFAFEVPGDIDVSGGKVAAPKVQLSTGPMTTPMSFDNVSPFGTRQTDNKRLWYVIIGVVGALAIAGVVVLFFLLFLTS